MPRPRRKKITSKLVNLNNTNTTAVADNAESNVSNAKSTSRWQPPREALKSVALQSKKPLSGAGKPQQRPPIGNLNDIDDERAVGAIPGARKGRSSNDRRRESEAANQDEHSASRVDGPSTGHVRASMPPSPKAMMGFEEYLASSSPRMPQPESVARAQATPPILSMSGFKRRPRQPSLLQMVQQQSVVAGQGVDEGDVDDSILRNLERSSPVVAAEAGNARLSRPRKRKSDEMAGAEEMSIPSSPPSLRPEYPGLEDQEEDEEEEEVQVPATQPQQIEIFEDERENLPQSASRRTSRRSDLAPRPSQHIRSVSRDDPPSSNDLVRSSHSPATSAPAPQAAPAPKARTTARPPVRRRNGRIIRPKHAPPTQRSPSPAISAPSPVSSSSPPSQLTHPAAPASKSRVKVSHRRSDGRPLASPKPETVSTEALRKLLPRQRKRLRPHDEPFELRSSSPVISLDASYSPPAAARSRRKPLKARIANTNATTGGKTTGGTRKVAPKARKTYGRGQENADVQHDVDGENGNDDGEEGNTTFAEASKSKELTAAAKKFAEIDQWDLSFESCDVGGRDSSPWR